MKPTTLLWSSHPILLKDIRVYSLAKSISLSVILTLKAKKDSETTNKGAAAEHSRGYATGFDCELYTLHTRTVNCTFCLTFS
jgi:hypothetical protein